jgi:branched-chain amino acid aminotransferase
MLAEPRSDAMVWLDGELVPWSSATMHVSDHHYGVGVFEGVRAYANEGGAAVFRLADHTERLFRSAHILKLTIPERFDRAALNRAQLELLRKNGLRDAYIRPFIFHGGMLGLAPRIQGLRVHVAILALEWRDDGAFSSSEAARRGIALRTASFTRPQASSLLAKAKANANYMSGILAREEAREHGADDAILLDRDGCVTETSGANVFVVQRGVIYTPPREMVLEGITRDTVFALAGVLGKTVTERRMTREDLYVADEVFVTGTAAEVTPVRELDGRRIGRGAPGEVSEKLRAMYGELVRGRGDHFQQWLTRF